MKPEKAAEYPDKLKLTQCKVKYPVNLQLMVGIFLDLMNCVVRKFNARASADPARFRPDMGSLATVAMFEEHCRSNANVFTLLKLSPRQNEIFFSKK